MNPHPERKIRRSSVARQPEKHGSARRQLNLADHGGLARLEARVALVCAAGLLSAVRLVEEPPMIDLLSFRAPKRLLVTSVRNAE